MTLELGSILGAIALFLVPLVAWLSGRFTRESRLLARIDRWAKVYAALPDSPARDRLGEALTAAAGELNLQIDTNSRTVRRWRNWSSALALVAAWTAALLLQPIVRSNQLGSFVLYAGLGVIAGAVSVGVTELVERRAARKSARDLQEAKEAAFRAGSPLPHQR